MKYILIYIFKFYKKFLSPMFPPSCRFYPSCSSYFIEALEKHGIFIGTFLGIKRVLRCNPFFEGGFDPVPEKFHFKRIKLKKLDG